MRRFAGHVVAVALLGVSLSGFASTNHTKTGTSGHKSTSAKAAGMDSERATEIQTALIKQGYLTGEPSGTWDAASVAAMQKLQADNGWQTKFTPDARALIKLGLGGGNESTGPAEGESADAGAQ